MSYPKWVNRGYGLGDILCRDADEEAAVHAERDARENPQPEPVEETVDTLRAKLDAAGVAYDKRWGIDKLKAALPQE